MNPRLDVVCGIVALLASLVAVSTGVRWGTFAAGGSDSYCYLAQAESFARGEVIQEEPLGKQPGWPGTPGAWVPTGHLPAGVAGGAVPICPAGYPAMMALARIVAGRTAMFWMTPLLGGVAVWLAYFLARTMADARAGAGAAVLTAASPMFLYQVVQPMNDVPATAMWMAALAAAASGRGTLTVRAIAAGLMSGVALTIRPNLLPLATVVGLGTAALPQTAPARQRLVALVAFGVATVPGLAAVLAVQHAMHGSPFRSGYGDLDFLFSTSHLVPNSRQYARWLIETHTPVVLAGLAAPLLVTGRARRVALLLLAFIAVAVACYLPYAVFDAWWYLRFLLPAIIPLIVLTSVVLAAAAARLQPLHRTIVAVAVTAILATLFVRVADRRQAFELKRLEARFVTAGRFVNSLPRDAVIVTAYQSGSVRFYSGRSTVAWGDIYEDRLPDALDFLRRHGRKPYLLFETWEEPLFKQRFARHHPLGTLEWPPRADIDRVARIYDPDDYDRYMRGEYVPTELIRTRR